MEKKKTVENIVTIVKEQNVKIVNLFNNSP